MSWSPGVRRARELLSLLDPRAESPMESYLRLLLIDAGLPRPEANANVCNADGEFLARADLPSDRRHFAHDVRRDNMLAAAG